jgi:hypothetical protein
LPDGGGDRIVNETLNGKDHEIGWR